MDFSTTIARQLDVRAVRVTAAVALLDDGNTIPFVARYRKEATDGLDEAQLRQIVDLLDGLRALEKRRETVLSTIAEQGQLTEELEAAILAADNLTALEDLYQPYKPKRRTRASVARQRGLQGLADLILAQPLELPGLAAAARAYLTDAVNSPEEAWAGARDIVAEVVSDHPAVRGTTRQKALTWAVLQTTRQPDVDDPRGVYRLYYDFSLRVDRLRPHQVLAINRAESEGIVRVSVDVAERDWRGAVAAVFRPDRRSPLADQLVRAIEDGVKRLLLPAIERDVRRALTETAEAHAIDVFATNLRGLLTQPPLVDQTILGIDPGYRTGCKAAVVDPTGKVLATVTVYPHHSKKGWTAAKETLSAMIRRHEVTLIAIGNGTASRETEQLAAELIGELARDLHYLIVSEAGASVYSASELARAELPELDVTLRGAVSIARRVQDPLAELVKIDPRSIGVGLYQHDVNQGQLSRALEGVVESVVNQVGVDANTASPALLTYVAGLGPRLAERVVAHRDAHGRFASRQALLQVSGLGPKSFQQAAGFLRIRDGAEPLDASAIHPESYAVARAILERARLTIDAPAKVRQRRLAPWLDDPARARLAQALDVGIPTLSDILEQLLRPGRDPREDLPPPVLRSDILSMADLREGMRLKGTVRNVVDFGAFVDIGVKHDGLLHRSQWPQPADFGVGDVIEIVILKVDAERGRISLGWSS
ncbi:MAG: Tex family protein [Candidatus Promineifilaceae bacterium]|nr:Tex family protein [Candidatus Promineifilaceae bacterium]